MNTIIIDCKDITTPDNLHLVLQKELNLAKTYGKNLDALYDSLTGDISLPVIIRLTNFEHFSKANSDYAQKISQTFRDAEQEVEGLKIEIL